MSLKKKVTMAVMTTTLGATIVAAGSFALFTASASNTSNTFTAGTVKITDQTGNGNIFAGDVNVGNLAPGDKGSGSITVVNNGTLDEFVRIDPALTTLSGNIFGNGGLSVTVDSTIAKLAPGKSTTFTLPYSMPLAAGNEYQAATGTVGIVIDAVQVRNNDGSTAPLAWQ